MHAIKNEMEASGREYPLHAAHKRRFATMSDSNCEEPVFPNRSQHGEADSPSRLLVADPTYTAILGGFVHRMPEENSATPYVL